MKESDSVEAAAHVLQAQIPEIEQCAANYIEKKDMIIRLRRHWKPLFSGKTVWRYGVSGGNYNALNVRIGEATGKNWWCILYPTLCFVDSTYQTVPDESKEKLKENSTEIRHAARRWRKWSTGSGFWEWFR